MVTRQKINTFEEFKQYEQETIERLHELDDNRWSLDEQIKLLKQLYLLSRKFESDGNHQKYLLKYLHMIMRYGYFLKGQWQGNGKDAEKKFIEALGLNKNNPLALYRLGHIYYNQAKDAEALMYFTKSLEVEEQLVLSNQLKLENHQEMTAKKFISYFSVNLLKAFSTGVLNHEQYDELNADIEEFISNPLIKINQKTEQRFINQTDYENLLENDIDTLMIDKYNIEPSIHFNGKSLSLPLTKLTILEDLLNKVPLDKLEWPGEFFYDRSIEANKKYFRRLVERLSTELMISSEKLGLIYSIKDGKQSVVFEPEVPYLIINRNEQ